jgi:hypothetical protein
MASKDHLPTRENELKKWVYPFLRYLKKILERAAFPPAEYELLETLYEDFSNKLDIVSEPSTRTTVTVKEKNVARKALEKELRQAIREYLAFNRSITDIDREALGLPVHKTTRTPAPIATTPPSFEIDTAKAGHVGIHFFAKESARKRGKPLGQRCVEIAWAFSEKPPTRWDELIHSIVDTSSPYIFIFENDFRGRTIYFALRWENTRGEKGPWTTIQSVIIP